MQEGSILAVSLDLARWKSCLQQRFILAGQDKSRNFPWYLERYHIDWYFEYEQKSRSQLLEGLNFLIAGMLFGG